MHNNIEISIIMLTYNHAPYLKKAIEGVMMQKTNFAFELIIVNDASPDYSDDILVELQQQYPNVIKYYKHKTNIGFVENQRFALAKVKGKYIAYCEGDDYWTDERKLQFQYDFLEANQDFVMTTGRNLLLHENTKQITDDGKNIIFGDNKFIDYTQESFFSERPTQTFTYLIRTDAIDLKWIDIYPNYRDLYYFYHALAHGKGRAFNKIFGVYRLHDGGVYSSLETEKKLRTSINIFTNIKKINNDKRANVQIIRDLDLLIQKYFYLEEFPTPILNKNLYQTVFERFNIDKNIFKLIKNLLQTIKYSLIR